METLLIGILLLKHVFHITVKELDYFCSKTLRINFSNNRSLTSPVSADSQSKLLSKCLQLYLKYLKQVFITNPESPRIAAVGRNCSYRTGSSALSKKQNFWRHPSLLNIKTDNKWHYDLLKRQGWKMSTHHWDKEVYL